MSNRMIPPTVRSLLKAADTHEVTIDPKVRTQLERAVEVVSRASTIQIEGPDLGTAVTDALLDGRDIGDDPDVIRAIVREHVNSPAGLASVVERATGQLGTMIRQNLDELLAAFQPAVAEASEAFTKAHTILAGSKINSLTDPALATAPLHLAEAGLDARTAQAKIHSIRTAIDGLLIAVDRKDPTPIGRITQWADPGDHTTREILALGKNPEEWALLAAGFTISLATPSENVLRRGQAEASQAEVNREASRNRGQEALAAAYAAHN